MKCPRCNQTRIDDYPKLRMSGLPHPCNWICHVCGRYFDSKGLQHWRPTVDAQEVDWSNPGAYVVSTNIQLWIKYLLSYEVDIYDIAEWLDVRPGLVRLFKDREARWGGYVRHKVPRTFYGRK